MKLKPRQTAEPLAAGQVFSHNKNRSKGKIKGKRLNTKIVAELFSNLGFMMTSGITLKEALASLSEYGDKNIRKTSDMLRRDIENGDMLWSAVKRQEKVIGRGYYKQICAGEIIGKTGETLTSLAKQITAEHQTSEKVKSAMVYPSIILLITAIVAWYMFTNVVPQIAETLRTLGGELPQITVTVIRISEVLVNNSMQLMVLIMIVFFGLRWILKNPLRMQTGRAILHIPMYGKLNRNKEYLSFYRSMYGLLQAGSPVADAITAASETLRNPYIQREMETAAKNFYASGSSLVEVMRNVKTMGKIELTAISAGVRIGDTSRVLAILAKRLDDENEELMKRMLVLFDPAMLIVVGSIVGTVLLSVYLPIFSIMSIS